MPTSQASPSTVVVGDSVSGVRINTSATSSEPSTSQGTSSGQNLSEITKLFPYFQTQAQKGSTNRFKYAPYPKFKPKETWTHVFICLANKDAETVPTRPEKSELNDAGLGEQKIVFPNKNGSFAHVRSTLEKVFPKMKDLDGAFEILRTTSCARRFLSAIPIPPLGYTVPVLKDGLGHATAYIRPMQKNLSMESVSKVSDDNVDLKSVPTIKCVNCGEVVALSVMRNHHCDCQSSSMEQHESIREKDIATLKEMFPNECTAKLSSVLSTVDGDLNKAAASLAGCVAVLMMNLNQMILNH
ncbi:Hypothetical predicted protein [Paramuricea clavata]|uniref:Uncharacterized protein n=1 Tax=Paramuricea clavata TaxID=317549 RepID=A0A7D9IG80_PARCT|nr:Hypothetical predicted protein [Paramuricea clavata]